MDIFNNDTIAEISASNLPLERPQGMEMLQIFCPDLQAEICGGKPEANRAHLGADLKPLQILKKVKNK